MARKPKFTRYVTLVNLQTVKGRSPRYGVAHRDGAVVTHRPLTAATDVNAAKAEAQALFPDRLVVALPLGERVPEGLTA